MNTIDYTTGTTYSSNVLKTYRSYQRMYRGFSVLNCDITSSRPSHRAITYRGVHGVYSNVNPERSTLLHHVIYRGFPLNALAA